MRIAIVTALWGRPELTRIILDYYKRMADCDDLELVLLCAVSRTQDTSVAMQSGWHTVYTPNDPLSQKFNKLFETVKAMQPDAVLLTGSDDLIQKSIVKHYADNYTADTPDLVGLKDIYFYGIEAQKALYWNGWGDRMHSKGIPRTIGAGRLFSRRILEMMQWRPWQKQILPRGLDSASSQEMRRKGIGEIPLTMEEAGGIVCDFKYATENLTKFRMLYKHTNECATDAIESAWPTEFAAIKALRTGINDPFDKSLQ